MKDSWKLAALLATWASLGLVGCAGDTAAQELEEPAASLDTAMSTDAYVDEAATPWTPRPPHGDDHGPFGDDHGPFGNNHGPFGELSPPLCPPFTSRVGSPSEGYHCESDDPREHPRPYCRSPWRLITFYRDFMCEKGGSGAPHLDPPVDPHPVPLPHPHPHW